MRADTLDAAEALFPDDAPTSKAGRGASAGRALAGLLERAELFHASDERAYAALDLDGHRETHAVRSKRFRAWLGAAFYGMSGKAVPGTAMTEALGLAEARALGGPVREVYLRVAEVGGCVYYDLADSAWRAVEVDATGWRVLDRPPVHSHELALEASPVAPVVRALAAEVRRWVGTASELLAELSERAGETVTRAREWPRSPRALAGVLRRLAPSLRAVGVAVEFNRATDSGRRRHIEVSDSSVRTVHPVHQEGPAPDVSDGSDDEIPTLTEDVVNV